MKKKKKKNFIQKLGSFFFTLTLIAALIFSSLAALNIIMGEEFDEIAGNILQTNKKEVINALVCGINDNMTDTIMYIRYEVKTGKIGIMSIPRDTSIAGSTPPANSSYKINSIYRGSNTTELVKEVEDLIDVKIDYYLFFDSKMLISMIDEIGGIEVNVPMRMKYDDPTQNLHIDLQPGTQVLNGKQAEQFVRFRKNNDGTGYSGGDIERTKTQQEFIKKFISSVLSPKNVFKIKNLIEIALNNTDTNITLREALKYVTDLRKVDVDNMVTCTAPGNYYDATNPVWVSFWVLDEDEVRRVIKEDFVTHTETEKETGTDNDTNK